MITYVMNVKTPKLEKKVFNRILTAQEIQKF